MQHQPCAAAFAAWAQWVGFLSFWSNPTMPDDNKRQHDVKLWLTDREFIDFCKLADTQDRKPGELGRVILRKYMYGNVDASDCDCKQAHSADKGRADL